MSFDITSKDNAKVKYIKKLITVNAFRKKEKKFVIEGIRLCHDAYLSNTHIKELYYTESIIEKYPLKIKEIIGASKKAYKVPEKILKNITDTKNPQGIVCVCEELDKRFSLDKINNVEKFIILENIQDPANLGTILRTAEAVGLINVIMSDDCCDVYNPKVLRGSMGAIFRLNICFSMNICNTVNIFMDKGIKTYAAVPDSLALPITKADFKGKVAVVVGNEGNGLTKETIKTCSEKITIPMLGRAESLNAAMAAGIIMWEMMRGSNA